MARSVNAAPGKRYYREMTVAHLREPAGADYVEVVFLESARFYMLRKGHPAFDEGLKLLRDALARQRLLTVGLASIDSDNIEEILGQSPSASAGRA
jgi:hypothetical protein